MWSRNLKPIEKLVTKENKDTIQYNIYLPYTTFTDGKKKMKKIDDRK